MEELTKRLQVTLTQHSPVTVRNVSSASLFAFISAASYLPLGGTGWGWRWLPFQLFRERFD